MGSPSGPSRVRVTDKRLPQSTGGIQTCRGQEVSHALACTMNPPFRRPVTDGFCGNSGTSYAPEAAHPRTNQSSYPLSPAHLHSIVCVCVSVPHCLDSNVKQDPSQTTEALYIIYSSRLWRVWLCRRSSSGSSSSSSSSSSRSRSSSSSSCTSQKLPVAKGHHKW